MPESKKTAKPPAGRRGARSTAKSTAAKTTKRKADAAATRAKSAGASGARLTHAKAQLRNSMILARVAQGVPWGEVAKEAGISARSCQRVAEDARNLRSPIEQTPMQLLEDLAGGFARSIADYEGLAFAWSETNQSAALGAKKAADETRARLASLLADVGKLPSNLELFRSEMEMRRIASKMIEEMREVSAGKRTPEEAMETFREMVERRAQVQLEAGAG